MSAARPLLPDEEIKLLAALDRRRDQVLFLFGRLTGFRITELLSVRVGDIWDLAGVRSEITLSRQRLKGGHGVQRRRVRSRTVPLNPRLRGALQTYLDERFAGEEPSPGTFLFASRTGENRPISRVQAYRILKAAAAATGRPERVATHSLRKTFAQDVFERSGHNLVLTQRALGHSSVMTTARYVSPDEDAISAAILGLGAPAGTVESFPGKAVSSVPASA